MLKIENSSYLESLVLIKFRVKGEGACLFLSFFLSEAKLIIWRRFKLKDYQDHDDQDQEVPDEV